MKLSRSIKALLGVVISFLLVCIILSRLDFSKAADRLQNIDARWCVAALGASFAVLCMRAMRFWCLTVHATLIQNMRAVALQNFINRILPLRLGELSLPYFLHRQAAEIPGEALSHLVLVRLVEMWVVCVAVLIGAFSYFGSDRLNPGWLLAILLVMSLCLCFYRPLLCTGSRLGLWILQKLGCKPQNKLIGFLQQMERTATEGRFTLKQKMIILWGSVGVVGLQALNFWAIMKACGVSPGFAQALIGTTVAHVAGGLPVLSVGTIGPHETSWVLAFMWVGLDKDDAILTGLATQVVTLLFAAIYATIAWIQIQHQNKTKA